MRKFCMSRARIRGFADSVPFVIIAVELDEQPGLLVMSNLLRVPPGDAVIGRRVEVEFEPIEGGFALPQFCLAGSESRPKIAP